LRFALFLAALIAAGPMPSPRAVDAARVAVGIAWFHSDRIVTPSFQTSTAIHASAAEPRSFSSNPARVFRPFALPHSLFQRPPPFRN